MLEPNGKLPRLGGMIDGNFYCVMWDGNTKLIKRDFDEAEMMQLIRREIQHVPSAEKVFVKK